MRTDARKYPQQGKLAPNWKGPFRIIENLQMELTNWKR